MTPSSVAALCPACSAPVSVGAYSCAFCDHRIRTTPRLSLAAANSRRPCAETPVVSAVRRLAIVGLKRVAKLAIALSLLAFAALSGFVALLTRDLRQMSAGAARRTESAVAARTPDAAWPAIEAAAARAGVVPGAAPRSAAPDTAAARLLATAAMSERSLTNDIWEIDSAAIARWGLNQSTHRRVNYPYYAAKLLPGALPDSTRRMLVADTLSPWLGAWRQAARSAPLPPLWAYKPGFPGVADSHSLPLPSFGALKVLAWRNASAGVLALERGDSRTAELRARENIAVGMHLLREPIMLENLIGRVMVRDAALLLAEVGRVSGDSALVGEGTRLDTTLKFRSLPIQSMVLGWGGMAGDAAAPAALRFAADTTLSPAERAFVLETVPLGACQNTREVLFGFDRRRADAVEQAAQRVASDAPGVARIGELSARGARAWSDDLAGSTESLQRGRRPRPDAIQMLDRVGLDGVAGRLTICGYLLGMVR